MLESKDILTLFQQLNTHEVFTPPRVARDMLTLLPRDLVKPTRSFTRPCHKVRGAFVRGYVPFC